jgi:hypothetical protein
MALKTWPLAAACAALVGLSLAGPATATQPSKPSAGISIVVDRFSSPIYYTSWPYPNEGPDVRAIGIRGTLYGCTPGVLYLWSGSSTLGPELPNFALGQWDGVECGQDATLRIGTSAWEDPDIGTVLTPGMKGTASLSAWRKCLGEENGDPCDPTVTGEGKVQIPRR